MSTPPNDDDAVTRRVLDLATFVHRHNAQLALDEMTERVDELRKLIDSGATVPPEFADLLNGLRALLAIAFGLLDSGVARRRGLPMLPPDCTCRTSGCGHPASEHVGPGGACRICQRACWS